MNDKKPEPIRPPTMHDPSTVAVVEIGGRWYTRFTTLALPLRGAALVGTTYYMPHDEASGASEEQAPQQEPRETNLPPTDARGRIRDAGSGTFEESARAMAAGPPPEGWTVEDANLARAAFASALEQLERVEATARRLRHSLRRGGR